MYKSIEDQEWNLEGHQMMHVLQEKKLVLTYYILPGKSEMISTI